MSTNMLVQQHVQNLLVRVLRRDKTVEPVQHVRLVLHEGTKIWMFVNRRQGTGFDSLHEVVRLR